MTVIEPKLQRIFDEAPSARRPETWITVLFKWDGALSQLKQFGMRLGPTSGGIVSAQMPLSKLPDIHRLGIESIETPRQMYPSLDVSRKDIEATALPTTIGDDPGKGVVVGIIDSGIDYTHPCFRKADGSTRILYLWDQRVEMVPPRNGKTLYPGENLPADLDDHLQWGVEYTEKSINDALKSGARPLRLKDGPMGHGSHIAGIAVGNGQQEIGKPLSPYVGIATHADLIFVAVNFSSDPARPSRRPNPRAIHPIRQAIEYIIARAKGRPWVINLSFGHGTGARDGNSADEQSISNYLNGAGRAIVASAGNNANAKLHAAGRVVKGGDDTLTLTVDAKEPAERMMLEIWFGLTSAAERFDVLLTDPHGYAVSFAGPMVDNKMVTFPPTAGTNKITISSTLPTPNEKKNRIEIDIAKSPENGRLMAGTWTLKLTGRTVASGSSSGRYHAYLSTNRDSKVPPPAFPAARASGDSTLISPSTAKGVICVGSFITKPASDPHKLSGFSSHGPTLDGRHLPTLCAPGEKITSVHAGDGKAKPDFVAMQGTSMAAPHVTGVVAAMLQVNSGLTPESIAAYLMGQSDPPPNGSKIDEWGSGRVNAKKAVTAVKTSR